MQHDHQVSKARGKSAGPAIRKEASTHLAHDARAVIDLQQAAGNRAVANMLTASANGVNGPRANRSAASPISLQRDPLDDALKHEMDGRDVDYLKLAHALVSGADTMIANAGTSPKEADTPATGGATSPTGKVAAVPTKTDEARAAEKRTKDLAEMKRLKNLSSDQIKVRDQAESDDKQLADWTAQQKRAKQAREMKRLKNLSPDEIKARDQAESEDDELADWTEKQKAAKEARSSVREAAKLNPDKKSMRSLLKGRSF